MSFDFGKLKNDIYGYSLIEMSIVMLLMGIIMTIGMFTTNAMMSYTATSATKKRIEIIKSAMIGYLRSHNRLPCPDTTYGVGDSSHSPGEEQLSSGVVPAYGGACVGNFGVIPFYTIGITRDQALDGWENFFSYHVSQNASNLWTTSSTGSVAIIKTSSDAGEITINSRNSSGGLFAVTTSAVFAVVSHGNDGKGAYTVKGLRNIIPDPISEVDQYQNTNTYAPAHTTPNTYIKRDFSDRSDFGGPFDDIVDYATADTLINPMIQEGSNKSQPALLAERFTKIRNALLVYAASDSVFLRPCGLPPWAASTPVAVGTTYAPSASTGYQYNATAAGITGAAPPGWSTVIGGITPDGTVTWTTAALTDWRREFRYRLPTGDYLYGAASVGYVPGYDQNFTVPGSSLLGTLTFSAAIASGGYGIPYTILGLDTTDIEDPWSTTNPRERLLYIVTADTSNYNTSSVANCGVLDPTCAHCLSCIPPRPLANNLGTYYSGSSSVVVRVASRGQTGIIALSTIIDSPASCPGGPGTCLDIRGNDIISFIANSGGRLDNINTCP
ncbi:MAG: type II secretion system protein [Magnetococcales bacterium]|nr:type II secretion system protein [Magnetococcales bacterium]